MGLVAGAVDMGAAVGTAAMAAMGTAVSAPALMAAAVTLAGAGTVVAGAGGIGARGHGGQVDLGHRKSTLWLCQNSY